MSKLKLDHGRGGLQHASDKLGDVRHKVDVQAVHGTHGPASILQVVAEGAEHCRVRVQLDLAGAIEYQVVILSISLQCIAPLKPSNDEGACLAFSANLEWHVVFLFIKVFESCLYRWCVVKTRTHCWYAVKNTFERQKSHQRNLNTHTQSNQCQALFQIFRISLSSGLTGRFRSVPHWRDQTPAGRPGADSVDSSINGALL